MADITVTKNPVKVVAADTNENTVVFNDMGLDKIMTKPQTMLFLEVTVGTFRFSAGKTIASSADEPTYTVGAKLAITVSDSERLRFKAAAISDSFNIAF